MNGKGESQNQPPAPENALSGARTDVTAMRMHREFDRSFSLQPVLASGNARDFVIVQVAGERYALALADLQGIERPVNREALLRPDPLNPPSADASPDTVALQRTAPLRLVAVPSSQPALSGIRCFRGRITPVFALAVLLGAKNRGEETHCAVVSTGKDQIAFAFDALVELIRVEPEQIFAAGSAARSWQQETVSEDGELYTVIAIAALVRELDAASALKANSIKIEERTS